MGERVNHLDLGAGRATTSARREVNFSHLALATGARPRRLTLPGADLAGVHYLRDVADADVLRLALPSAQRVVIIGGGFVGLEAAAVARSHGKEVVVVEAAGRLLARAVAPIVSSFYRRAHERRGTVVYTDTGVAELRGTSRVKSVVCTDGTTLPADLVLVGIGANPRVELAESIGLEVDGGIVVDARGQTSEDRVVAAGDCTVQPHPVTGTGRIRLESVQNAVDQAKAAAATLASGRPPEPTVPWFWSDQGDLKLQIAGLSADADEYVVRGAPDEEKFSVLYFGAGRLLAVDSINRPTDYLAVRKALKGGTTLTPDAARDHSVDLRTLLALP